MQKSSLSFYDIRDMDPMELFTRITDHFICDIPVSCETPEEMKEIADIMPVLANRYSYLMSVQSYLKVCIRMARKEKKKEKVDELVDKNTIVFNTADGIKQQYKALSRMISVRQLVNEEIRML